MFIKSFAKINLFLDVTGKTDDGYHDLKMVMIPLELHDAIEITSLPYFKDDYITCDRVELRDSKYNTISLALKKMKEVYKFDNKFNIHVHKEIPIQSGLGGGSSNAGSVMSALNKCLKLNAPHQEMIDMAKTIGADVPFFIDCKPSLVEGIGEKLSQISLKHDYYVVILKPERGLSTKTVFAKCDEMPLEHKDINDVIKALETGDDELLAKSMFNSLEKPSFELAPELKGYKDMLIKDGFKMALMTGSGSCIYGLTSDKHFAHAMYKKYEKEGYEVYLTKTIK